MPPSSTSRIRTFAVRSLHEKMPQSDVSSKLGLAAGFVKLHAGGEGHGPGAADLHGDRHGTSQASVRLSPLLQSLEQFCAVHGEVG